MEQFYTAREANNKLPELTHLLHEMQALGLQLAELQGRGIVVKEKIKTNGDHNPSEDVMLVQSERSLEETLQLAISQLSEWNIQLKDLQRGLVDFPARLEGRTVFLCWELGEEEVGFWHET
ncbi:MAG: DUF2203 family protein, partial [Chloroflexia bacterium]